MLAIGITGTLGAGKGTVVEILMKHYGFLHFSVRAFITEEILKRNLPLNRDSMVLVANDLRQTHTPSYITDRLFETAFETGKNSVIESIRTPGEVASLRRQNNFYLLAIDALPELRYQRIVLRNSETDNVDYKTFIENEAREMTATDPNKQNLKACIEQADFVIDNSGTIADLEITVKRIMETILR